MLATVVVAVAVPLSAASPAISQETPPPNVMVTPDRKDGYQQPVMAEDPLRPGHLAIAFQEAHALSTCFLARSEDGGATWSTSRLAGKQGLLALPPDAFCWNPTLAFAPDGTLYYAFQTGFYFNQGDRRVLLTASRDGGRTFSSPTPVSTQPDANQFWPALAVDRDGRVFVAFTRTVFPPNGAGPIGVVRSDDGGRTFSPPMPVNPAHVFSLGSVLTVAEDGRVYIGYLDQGTNPFGSNPELIVGVSADRATTFSTSSHGPSIGGCLGTGQGFDRLHGDGPCRLITLTTSDRAGEAYAGWWDERGPENRARVVIAGTADGGSTWSPPRIVAVPAGRDADHQHRPWLATGRDGQLHLAFYNREGKDQDGPQDVFVASSGDRGTTFGPPLRVSDVSSDSQIGPTGRVPGGFPSLGDFLALVLVGDGVGVAWTDMRRGDASSGKQDIVFARLGPALPNSAGGAVDAGALTVGEPAPAPAPAPGPQLPATGRNSQLAEVAFAFMLAVGLWHLRRPLRRATEASSG